MIDTGTAIGTIRALTSQLDPTIAALLEAHGFTFTRMSATPGEASACFTATERDDKRPWHLGIAHAGQDEMSVSLTSSDVPCPSISLRIVVGKDGVANMAEAVGLAVSFVTFTEQLRGVC